MPSLVLNCPHCPAESAGFTALGQTAVPNALYVWNVLFHCNSCLGPVVAVIETTGSLPLDFKGNLARHQQVTIQNIFPKAKPLSAPAQVPDSVARAFLQAEDAIKRQHWEASGAMDRRALEIATKEMAPEHADRTLYQRIEKLAEAGKLTPSLKEWAHDLRLLGNEALHEIDGVSEDEATQAHELTRFVLIYLYTLPAQVAQARAERQNRT